MLERWEACRKSCSRGGRGVAEVLVSKDRVTPVTYSSAPVRHAPWRQQSNPRLLPSLSTVVADVTAAGRRK